MKLRVARKVWKRSQREIEYRRRTLVQAAQRLGPTMYAATMEQLDILRDVFADDYDPDDTYPEPWQAL